MKAKSLIVFALCAVMCAGAVSCDNDDSKPKNKGTSVTAQEQLKTKSNNENPDYKPVSIEGMTPIKTGWIKLPGSKEYVNLLNNPDETFLNGYAYADMPAEVYKEEGEWLLIKTRDKVGYIQSTYFTETDPSAPETSEEASSEDASSAETTAAETSEETTTSSEKEDTTDTSDNVGSGSATD